MADHVTIKPNFSEIDFNFTSTIDLFSVKPMHFVNPMCDKSVHHFNCVAWLCQNNLVFWHNIGCNCSHTLCNQHWHCWKWNIQFLLLNPRPFCSGKRLSILNLHQFDMTGDSFDKMSLLKRFPVLGTIFTDNLW